MKTMIHRHTMAIAFSVAILFSPSLTLFAQEAADAQEPSFDPAAKMQALEHAPWESIKFDVYSMPQNAVAEINGFQATYSYKKANGRTGSSQITAFVFGQPDLFWIGPKQDFYVELESGIVGGRFFFGRISWFESLVSQSDSDIHDIEALIGEFEDKTDIGMLSPERDSLSITRLDRELDQSAFTSGSFGTRQASEAGSPAKIESLVIENNQLKLTISNSATSFRGEVWIDPQTREVTRSTQLSPAEEE